MLHKRHNSVVTLAVLLTLVGVSKPAKAFLLAQSDPATTTFTVPDKLPEDAVVKIASSNSTNSINNSLKDSFAAKYPQAEVNIETQDSNTALKNVSDGQADLAAIGRNLTAEEQAEGFTAVPVSREKIAVVVSPSNSYDGNLTIDQFARIFRGEITDWAEIGGNPGRIELVDMPDSNDTRQAFPNYPVFQTAEFSTGDTATKIDADSTEAMIENLGENSISYAVANDVTNRDDVKIVTMHQTQPDDSRYPFSQPFNLVYRGTPNEAAKAYVGYATAEGGQEVVTNRVGSISTAVATAIAPGAASPTDGVTNVDPEAGTPDGNGGNSNPNVDVENAGSQTPGNGNVDADVDGEVDPNAVADNIDGDVEGTGEANTDLDGSGEVNADLNGSGEANTDLNGSGEANTDLNGSGEVNTDFNDSGEVNPNVEGSGEPLSSDAEGADGEVVVPADEVDGEVVVPNDAADEAEVAAKKGSKWWLLLIPLLAIPLLGALLFGGRKRSDREPAVDNVPPNINPNGGVGVPNTPDGGGVPPIGANVSNNLGNATGNTVNTASSMGAAGLAAGGAALAGGAANLAGRNNRTENANDLDLDDSITAEEIPSNPVTEFTGQETKLQVGDTDTKLQDEDIDFDRSESGFDGISSSSRSGVAAFDRDLEAESMVESQNLADSELNIDTGSQFTADNRLENSVDSVNAEGREFPGDFVLPEEGKDISVSDGLDVDTNANSGTGIINGATAGGAALGGAAAAGFLNRDRTRTDANDSSPDTDLDSDLGDRNRTVDLTENVVEVDTANIDTGIARTDAELDPNNAAIADGADSQLSDRDVVIEVDDSSQVDSDLGDRNRTVDLTGDVVEVDTANIDTGIDRTDAELNLGSQTTPELDPNIDPNVERTDNPAIIGGAAALGGVAAAASRFSERDRTESDDLTDGSIDVNDSDLDDRNRTTDLTEEIDEVNTSSTQPEIDVIDLRTEPSPSDSEVVPDSNQNTELNLGSQTTPEIDSDLELSDRNSTTDLTEEIDEVNTSSTEPEIDVIDLRTEPSPSDSEVIPDSSDTELNLGSQTTPEISNIDPNAGSGSNAAAIGGAALGGAAASEFLNRDRARTDEVDLGRDADLDLDLDLDLDDRDRTTNSIGGIGEVKTSNLDTGSDLDSETTSNVDDLDVAAQLDTEDSDLDRDLDFMSELDLNDRQDESANPTGNINEVNTLNIDRSITDSSRNTELDLDDETTPELDLSLDLDSDVDDSSRDTSGSETVSGLSNTDTERTAEIQEFETFETSFDISADSQSTSFADNVIADAETTAIDEDLQAMNLYSVAGSDDAALDEIATDNEGRTINASLEDITFDEADSEEISLNEIDLDDNEVNLDSSSTDEATPGSNVEDIRLEDLGFADAEPVELTTDRALESNVNDDLSSRSDDMSNISQWLDSLETPNRDSDNISDWLDTLDKDSTSSDINRGNSNQENTDLNEEDDISFQFLEDLLDREDDSNQDNK